MIKLCGTASSLFAVAAQALQTRPNRVEWGQTLLISALFTLTAGYLGLGENLFKFAPTAEWQAFAIVAVAAIFIPSFAEELVFRVLLGGKTGWIRAGLAISAFVLWHPLQVWLNLPMAQALFLEPAFLAITGLLGLACTIAYRVSGSVWPPVFIHWITVIAWKGLTVPVTGL